MSQTIAISPVTRIEGHARISIRLYDPSLSRATHLHGRLGMKVELLSPGGKVLDSATV